MRITVDLPDTLSEQADPGRGALEALAVAGYRSRKLSQLQVGRILGLSRIQTEDFLARHVNLYDHPVEELEAEAELLQKLHQPG